MKKILFLFFLMVSIFNNSCTSEKVIFEKSDWWDGHWQNISDDTQFFSSGLKRVGGIMRPQFFHSTRDSIYSNFHMESLEDFDHRARWKLIITNEAEFIKIQEIDEFRIEVFGPTNTLDNLIEQVEEYQRIPEDLTPPFPDSILNDN